MNVDKVNATLLRAVNLFKEDENRILRSKSHVELKGIELPLAQMAKDIAEETGKPIPAVLDALVDGLSEAAARHFGSSDDLSEEKISEWLVSGGARSVAKQIVEKL